MKPTIRTTSPSAKLTEIARILAKGICRLQAKEGNHNYQNPPVTYSPSPHNFHLNLDQQPNHQISL